MAASRGYGSLLPRAGSGWCGACYGRRLGLCMDKMLQIVGRCQDSSQLVQVCVCVCVSVSDCSLLDRCVRSHHLQVPFSFPNEHRSPVPKDSKPQVPLPFRRFSASSNGPHGPQVSELPRFKVAPYWGPQPLPALHSLASILCTGW